MIKTIDIVALLDEGNFSIQGRLKPTLLRPR